MRIIYAIILALILAFPASAQRTPKTITADTATAALLWPTNLWSAERANIYSSLGLWTGATNQTSAAWRASLGLSENTTNSTALGWRSAIGVAEIATNTVPANWRAAIGVSEIATNSTAALFRPAIGVSEFATNATASGWRSALAVPANSGGFLTNATISGNSTFVGTALIGSTYTVATNAGVQFLDSNGDPKLAIVDGRSAFSDNWPVIADATDAFSPRYSVAVSNTAPSAGAVLNRGTADYRYGIPTTFSKTGLVQAVSAAVARNALGFDAGAPGAIGTNLVTTATAAAARSALGLGEWTTNSSAPSSGITGIVAVAQGGTGATNAAQARSSLGFNDWVTAYSSGGWTTNRAPTVARNSVVVADGVADGWYYAFPGLVRLPSGYLCTTFRKAGAHEGLIGGDVVYSSSGDNGRTWSTIATISAHDVPTLEDQRDTVARVLSDGRVLVGWFSLGPYDTNSAAVGGTNYTYNLSKIAICTETSPGVLSVSSTKTVYSSGAYNSQPILADICVLANGNWLVPAYNINHDIVIRQSTDEGANWTTIGSGLTHPNAGDEPRMCQLADGSLLMMIRENTGNKYYQSRSTDGGTNWSARSLVATLTSTPGKPSIIRLRNSNTVLFVSRGTTGTANGGPHLYYSHDGGTNWVTSGIKLASATGSNDITKDQTILPGGYGTIMMYADLWEMSPGNLACVFGLENSATNRSSMLFKPVIFARGSGSGLTLNDTVEAGAIRGKVETYIGTSFHPALAAIDLNGTPSTEIGFEASATNVFNPSVRFGGAAQILYTGGNVQIKGMTGKGQIIGPSSAGTWIMDFNGANANPAVVASSSGKFMGLGAGSVYYGVAATDTGVGIMKSTSTAAPTINTNAVLDIGPKTTSTLYGGVLLPRMTKANRNTIPVGTAEDGLTIWQIDAGNWGPRFYSAAVTNWVKPDLTTTDP